MKNTKFKTTDIIEINTSSLKIKRLLHLKLTYFNFAWTKQLALIMQIIYKKFQFIKMKPFINELHILCLKVLFNKNLESFI